MDLIMLVITLCLVGFVVWALTTRVQMPDYWATAIQIIALIAVLLWLIPRFIHLPNVLP